MNSEAQIGWFGPAWVSITLGLAGMGQVQRKPKIIGLGLVNKSTGPNLLFFSFLFLLSFFLGPARVSSLLVLSSSRFFFFFISVSSFSSLPFLLFLLSFSSASLLFDFCYNQPVLGSS